MGNAKSKAEYLRRKSEQGRFSYVIAHLWPSGTLAIYAYGSEVHQGGTLAQAQQMLDYVKRQSPSEQWAIYRVEFTLLNTGESSSG
jgi:hypothetical protein